jgi:hypothetical protein
VHPVKTRRCLAFVQQALKSFGVTE